MQVKFLYKDGTIWVGPPEEAHQSPDPRPPEGGVIIMYGITNDGRERTLRFLYDDVYYIYKAHEGWILGSGTQTREYLFKDESGCNGVLRPFVLPKGAVVRYGCTIPDEQALELGLLTINDKYRLRDKREVCVECK